ncbi:MAG TPA: lipase maturation factor family protein, partial [Nitriliruptorales bacterium]
YEVVIEGTLDDPENPDARWREYQFHGKPGELDRRPPQVAPYHLRLDWLLWFVPLSPAYQGRWFRELLEQLLDGGEQIRRLVRVDPFGGEAPRAIRARRFRYRFTTRQERRGTGRWWYRELDGWFQHPITRRRVTAHRSGHSPVRSN